MKITVSRIIPYDDVDFFRVIVHLHEDETEQPDDNLALSSADFDVWLPKEDLPLSEVERRAIQKVQAFVAAAQRSFGP